jgi:hypothetical protein
MAHETPTPYAPTTTRLLRPRRRVPGALVLIALLSLGFVPYPTQVFPAITVELVDPAGPLIPNPHPPHRHGVSNPAILQGETRFDDHGRAALRAEKIWASAYYRLLAATGNLHKLRGTYGWIRVELPSDYVLDRQAMRVTETPGWPSADLPNGDTLRDCSPGPDGNDAFDLFLENPETNRPSPLRITVRPRPSSSPMIAP